MHLYSQHILAFLIVLTLLGAWWCGAILRRLPEDMELVRNGDDPVHRGVIIAYWAFTVPVALGTLWAAWKTIAAAIDLFG